ncbi:hypothetical protein D9M72_403440 [compost metagenome]
MREIKREGGVDLFWMYSSVQFVEHANKYTTAAVSSESVAELQQVAKLDFDPLIIPRTKHDFSRMKESFYRKRPSVFIGGGSHEDIQSLQLKNNALRAAILNWIDSEYGSVESNASDFPEYIVQIEYGGYHGFELKTANTISSLYGSGIQAAIIRGHFETGGSGISQFTLITSIPYQEYLELNGTSMSEISAHFKLILSSYPIAEVLIGTFDTEIFVPLMKIAPP